jgi:anti-sigma factor RsiW
MNCGEIARQAPLYITGELDARQAAEFDAHLRTCEECMRELERQARIDARLREAVLTEEDDTSRIDHRVREMIAAKAARHPVPVFRPRFRGWAAAALAIAAAAIVLAGVGYRTLVRQPVAPVYAAAARDHGIEVVQHQWRPWLTDPSQIATLAEQQGIARSVVTALASGGYRLSRGKLCFLDHRIFLHLVYTDGIREFSVYLRTRDSKPLPVAAREISNGKPLCTSDLDGEHVASIETPQLTAVIVTGESSDAALKLARFASAVL